MIRVCIVDDHELVRQGLKMILKSDPEIVVVDEAKDGDEALEKIEINDYDVMLLDMNMPGIHGIELITELKKKVPKLNILVLSIYPEDKFALRTLKAGASGYLCKDTALEELKIAIKKVNDHGKYLSKALSDQLVAGNFEKTLN